MPGMLNQPDDKAGGEDERSNSSDGEVGAQDELRIPTITCVPLGMDHEDGGEEQQDDAWQYQAGLHGAPPCHRVQLADRAVKCPIPCLSIRQ